MRPLDVVQAKRLEDQIMHMFTWSETLEGSSFWNLLYCSVKPEMKFPTEFPVPEHVRGGEDDTLYETVDSNRLRLFRQYLYTSTTCTTGILYLLRRLDIIDEGAKRYRERRLNTALGEVQIPNKVPQVAPNVETTGISTGDAHPYDVPAPARRSAFVTPTSPRAVRRRLLLI